MRAKVVGNVKDAPRVIKQRIGQTGVVVKEARTAEGGRIFRLSFPDGELLWFYADEIELEEEG